MHLALEYQGDQHDRPVEYFGGEEAFKATQERDDRKSALCIKNGIDLIYVYPDYNKSELIELLKSRVGGSKIALNESVNNIKERIISYKEVNIPKVIKKTTLDRWLHELNPRRRIFDDEEITNYLHYCMDNLEKSCFIIEKFHWNKELAYKYHRHRDHDGFIKKCIFHSYGAIALFQQANKEHDMFKSGVKDQTSLHESVKGIFSINSVYPGNYVKYFTKELFKKLAIIYEKFEDYTMAIEVIDQAISYGFIEDGTKGGFAGRKLRLQKKLQI